MPQLILPMIPEGATQISDLVAVYRDNRRWTYYYGTHPIFYHYPEHHRMFRVITSQLIESLALSGFVTRVSGVANPLRAPRIRSMPAG